MLLLYRFPLTWFFQGPKNRVKGGGKWDRIINQGKSKIVEIETAEI